MSPTLVRNWISSFVVITRCCGPAAMPESGEPALLCDAGPRNTSARWSAPATTEGICSFITGIGTTDIGSTGAVIGGTAVDGLDGIGPGGAHDGGPHGRTDPTCLPMWLRTIVKANGGARFALTKRTRHPAGVAPLPATSGTPRPAHGE